MTRKALISALILMSASSFAGPASAATTHHYFKDLSVTPAMMAAIDTIVAEKARMMARHRRHGL